MEEKIYDMVIIGAGPAGMSAAVYAKRAELSVLVIERDFASGGQIVKTYEVDNYLGLPGIGGYELGEKFREHVDKFEVPFVRDKVQEIQLDGKLKKVITRKGEYLAKTVILAGGSSPRLLEIPGEEEFQGMGVSYCATCDGAFFRERVTAVIGGGDSAVEDVIFLSRICKKVYMIHRRDSLKASKSLQSVLDKLENVEILWDTVAEAIKGNSEVETLQIKNQKTQEKRELSVDGVFIAVGAVPNTKEFQNLIQLDEAGYIAAEEDCRTNVAGIYAAGDIRTKALRQVVTAVSDGANAVYSAQKYLSELA
ncbi:thioredoxin-disulfide reductase [Firmicutes bacterium CAG:227]|nr:thioredoxin-disulfide reductase [Blautia stercoris]CDC94434.1 thioredoxin-disulfide reductase [Firmicutes bacterium CAG:227]